MFDNKSLEEEPDGPIFLSRLRTSLDVKRTESLRGITVFRGQIPGSGSNKVTTNKNTADWAPLTPQLPFFQDTLESYL